MIPLTIFVSAALLFQIQPLLVKRILPWFGGSASVWNTSALFFQLALLAGYAYAHLIVRKLRPSYAIRLHAALLAASILLLPVIPSEHWKSSGSGEPVLRIVLLLAATAGLPYLLLASTSSLLQAFRSRAHPGAPPYAWYAVSNAGSLLGLLAYPVAIEPFWGARQQALAWSALYVFFVILMLAILLRERGHDVAESPPARQRPVPLRVQLSWTALAAAGSLLLLSATAYISENIAPVPLVWVLPLSAYLLSFVVSFSGRIRSRGLFTYGAAAGLLAMAALVWFPSLVYDLRLSLAVMSAGVFLVCACLHREIYRERPEAAHLTRFYLLIAAGGALGSTLVVLVAPLAVPVPVDFPIALSLCSVALLAAERPRGYAPRIVAAATCGVLLCVTVAYTVSLVSGSHAFARNFYGTLRVREENAEGSSTRIRLLTNGVIHHGAQVLEPTFRAIPVTYYAYGTGIYMAIVRSVQPRKRVGIVGLGTGALAAYARPGDLFRFYEINPAVIDYAQSWFTYLADTPGRIEIAPGDARVTLEREPPQNYDLLVLDAFSSDAIPAHLMTREAFAIYLRHLRPDGTLAFHITNKAINLEPVLAGIASISALSGCSVRTGESSSLYRESATWVLLSRNPALCATGAIGRAASPLGIDPGVPLWTDDYTSIWPILNRDLR